MVARTLSLRHCERSEAIQSGLRGALDCFAALAMMRLWVAMLAAIAAFALTAPLAAQDMLPPAPYAYKQLPDPAQERKAQALMETLRCLKCQSQSIADSDAPMAGDMRHQVRTRIAAGEDPEAIRQWLIERYGDYVSYTPQVKPITWPLFAAPLLFLALAAFLLRGRFRRSKGA
jgi:cytochrome c-type biogenesis protein CcmH/NrfF